MWFSKIEQVQGDEPLQGVQQVSSTIRGWKHLTKRCKTNISDFNLNLNHRKNNNSLIFSNSLISQLLNESRLWKCIFFSAFTIICMLQCWIILSDFFKYPTIINTYDVSPNLISILPAITICNHNRQSLMKLAQRNETIKRALLAKFPKINLKGLKSLVDRSEFVKFRDELSALLDKLQYDPVKVTERSTMYNLFDVRPDGDELIEWLGCAPTWSDSIDCGQLTKIDSIVDRICTTLLHRGAMHYDHSNNSLLFKNHSSEGTMNHPRINLSLPRYLISDFDAKEVIKIVLDFQPEDYGDLRVQIGAKLYFHDSNIVAGGQQLQDFFVTRGYRYDFHVSRLDTKQMTRPYFDCFDYEKEHLDSYRHRIDPRIPLRAPTCVQNCIARNILRHSKCWPSAVPYFRDDSLDPGRSFKICKWFKDFYHLSVFRELMRVEEKLRRKNEQKNKTSLDDIEDDRYKFESRPYYQRMKFYRKVSSFCWSICIPSSSYAQYTITVTRSQWPTDYNILFDDTGLARRRRHCCALIAIKFIHYHYDVHEHVPKYDITNTIGDIGGLLGVWLGLSIVSIYRVIDKLVSLCGQRSIELLRSKYWSTTLSKNN